MSLVPRKNLVEQTAYHLRANFERGRWQGYLPGVKRLADELGISRDTLRAALAMLEKDGHIRSRGSGRRREIATGEPSSTERRTLRVGILLQMPVERDNSYSQQMILTIKHRIELAGHACFFADRTMMQLGQQASRVARMVEDSPADAWIVYAASREVLEWFAARRTPVIALGGPSMDLPIGRSSTDTSECVVSMVDQLYAMNHRRIVLIGYATWHGPGPSRARQTFLDALVSKGIKPSEYNLPKWDETPEGLDRLLRSLFIATPPTALITMEPHYCIGVLSFLAQRGLQVPRDVSLACAIIDPSLAWHYPQIAHMEWPMQQHIRHIVGWVRDVARGKVDTTHRFFKATFQPGATLAPARLGR
jgi:DNA-binding LacI/PurR family transcriptional regulator